MTTSHLFLSYFIIIAVSLFLIIYGICALFFPEKLDRVYKRRQPKNKFFLRLYQFKEARRTKKLHAVNRIVVGIFATLLGIYLLYRIIHHIIIK